MLERALPTIVVTLAVATIAFVLTLFVLAYCAPHRTTYPEPVPSAPGSMSPAPILGPPVTGMPSPTQGVLPGTFCTTAGQLGYTAGGELMRCSATEEDTHLRWRHAWSGQS